MGSMKLQGSDVRKLFPKRDEDANKGDFGYVALIGGSTRYSGAIRLANMGGAAMRCGAGVVKLCVPRCIGSIVSMNSLEATLFPLSDDGDYIVFKEEEFVELSRNVKAIAIGMGIGNTAETKKAVEWLLKHYEGTLIIDADGLNALSKSLQEDPLILANSHARVALTPHLKEFSRLSGYPIDEIKGRPKELAMDFAKKNGAIVLLKGHITYITDGTDCFEVDRGTPGMATAGSGDVLSGILSAVVVNHEDCLLEAVAAGAYINGLAGEIAEKKTNEVVMTSGDTASSVKEAMVALLNSDI